MSIYGGSVCDKVSANITHRLMALIELADYLVFSCSQLVVCLDRSINQPDLKGLTRDLGWVGFELTTLAPWNGGRNDTSKEWLVLNIDI